MIKHLGQIHGIGARPAVGGHPVVMALQRQVDPLWLIDGLNVVRLQGEDVPRFDFLLALTHHMLRENVDFLCVFDASARPCIKELQGTYFAEVCERLIRCWPHRFSEVPARTIADVALLDIATMLGSKIITNDQYRDHIPTYRWLATESEERLCGIRLRRTTRPHREVLVWQDKSIEVPVPQKIRTFVQEYQELLAERDHSTPAAPA
jgi:hypothetical protein